MGLDFEERKGKPPAGVVQRRPLPLHADFNEQRNDKGRGRQTAKGQEQRAQDFGSASRRGHPLLGRCRQNHLDKVQRRAEREEREFHPRKSGEMKNVVFLQFHLTERKNKKDY